MCLCVGIFRVHTLSVISFTILYITALVSHWHVFTLQRPISTSLLCFSLSQDMQHC